MADVTVIYEEAPEEGVTSTATATVIEGEAPGDEALPPGSEPQLVAFQAALAAAEEGIEKALLAELALLLVIPIAGENQPFEKPKGSPWAAAFFMPESVTAATLGVGGQDTHVGLFQVDLNYPPKSGTADVGLVISEIRRAFHIGKILVYGETSVRITRFQGPRSREVDGFYRRSLTIYWEAHVPRPNL